MPSRSGIGRGRDVIAVAPEGSGRSEPFAHHLFALLPERLGTLGIEGVAAHTFADRADLLVVGHDRADVTVLAVAPAHLVGRGDYSRPDRGRRPLGDRLELEGRLALGRKVSIHLI